MKSVHRNIYLPNLFALSKLLYSDLVMWDDLPQRRLRKLDSLKYKFLTQEAKVELSNEFVDYIWFRRRDFLGMFGIESNNDFLSNYKPEVLHWKIGKG